MRINKFLAQATGISRRAADRAIEAGEVFVNGKTIQLGTSLVEGDSVGFRGKEFSYSPLTTHHSLVLLNKPTNYVCSRDGQGSQTIYKLLPPELHHLKPVGRLDKDSSGLLLLTDDGDLAYQYTHPKFEKKKVYEVELDHELTEQDLSRLHQGVMLDDGPSKLSVKNPKSDIRNLTSYEVTMSEGRNRQIRRTFAALGYEVVKLHRTAFGPYKLDDLSSGQFKKIVL